LLYIYNPCSFYALVRSAKRLSDNFRFNASIST